MPTRPVSWIPARRTRMRKTISRRPSVLPCAVAAGVFALAAAGPAQAAWTRVMDVSGSSRRSALEVRVDSGPKGTLAVWTRLVGSHTRIQARLVGPRGSLGAVRTLSAEGLEAGYPEVGVAADGSAVVGWWVDRAAPVVQARRIAPNGKLGPVLSISGGYADSFDVAVAPDGTATFVWVLLAAGDQKFASVRTRRLDPDGTLGPVRELDADTYEAWGPTVAAGPDGSAVAAWHRLDADGAGELVLARRIGPGGGIDPKRRLWAGLLSYEAPRVAVGSKGRATVVWTSVSEELRARRVDAGAPLGPVLALTKGAVGVLGPNVAMGAGGATTVVWGRAAGRGYSVEARRIGPGGSLGGLRTLARNGPDTAWPDVAMTPKGVAVVVWPAGEHDVYVRRLRPGGSLGASRKLPARGRVDQPHVALSASGAPTVVWTSQRPGTTSGARYVVEGAAERSTVRRIADRPSVQATGARRRVR